MNARQISRIVKARRYKALVREFPPRIIHGEADFDATCKVIEALMEIRSPSEDQLEFLEILSTLVTNYETITNPAEPVSLSHLLAHLIEAKGVSKAEVARGANVNPSAISDVLAGRRTLSIANIKRLSAYFHVSPSLFLEAIPPKQTAA